jgi:asparagine synthase (glutamine-hydrolysing)
VVGERGLATTRYWEIRPTPPAATGDGSAAEALRELLTDSVRLRLRSDVPVGTCLSGGIDSSSIVCLGTRLLGGPMDAYSVAYDEGPMFDERAHMLAACEAAGARHHLVVPRGEALLDELMAVTRAQEEPSAGPGVYSQWQVMRLAGANRAKVLLDGQGADELFGGYFAFYFPLRLRDLVARGDLAGAVALARAALRRGHAPLEVAARTAEPWIPGAVFRRGRRWLGTGDWGSVLTPELRATTVEPSKEQSNPALSRPRFADHLTNRQHEDLQRLLLPSLLRYEDRNSMAFSIEARVPFLDYRVVELAFALPPETKFDHGVTKRVLREAMTGIVPAAILARSDKRGFEAPVVRWLLARHRGWLREILTAGRAVERGFLDGHRVNRLLDRQLARPRGPGHEVWRLVSLELWLRAFFG